MIILGAGLNGCIAALRFPESQIQEYLNTPSVHKAVLRFRSDEVSRITGIPFKKVVVNKAIVVDKEFVNPNLQLNNLYSIKVTGQAVSRSIDSLEPAERYIAPSDFHKQMLDRLSDRITFNSNHVPSKFSEPTISTLPLPILCNMLNINCPIVKEEKEKPIHVRTIEFENADLYQTIYYPKHSTNVYRASMTGKMLIIESVDKISSRECMSIINDFGLTGMAHIFGEPIVQQFGKFIPLEPTKRKKLMLEITDNFGVYSLGRHATWRKLLLDDTPKDLDAIERLIKIDDYDLRIGK